MSVTEKVANNVLLQAIARVAMALFIPVFISVAGFVWAQHTAIVAQDKRIALVEQQLQVIIAINSKLEKLDDRTFVMQQSINRLEGTINSSR